MLLLYSKSKPNVIHVAEVRVLAGLCSFLEAGASRYEFGEDTVQTIIGMAVLYKLDSTNCGNLLCTVCSIA